MGGDGRLLPTTPFGISAWTPTVHLSALLSTTLSSPRDHCSTEARPPRQGGSFRSGSLGTRKTRTPRVDFEKLLNPEIKQTYRNRLLHHMCVGLILDDNNH
ncbi:hypothetical protein T265_03535 [Opisthorchis viverrini]|uniref:Uncharacterized protein n=1 Tax=Opisthorchis viverrini TaxID=6198 RepID=A0A074ZVM8_OPIVI|nr:hypothetical protein T265_03535 [Opisthorchis viverrini]KER29947.1 hypothetical protein T265_03535 [Opisthorchis viverrini]